MKKTIILSFILLMLICTVSLGQTDKREKFLHVIEALFPNYETDKVKNIEVIYTKVWDKHASIPLSHLDVAELKNEICAITFSIWLSDFPKDYRIMQEEELFSMDQLDENSKFTGGDQKLIQVVFYDFKNDKFLGKPDGFPISGLAWLPEEFTIPLEMTFTESLQTSVDNKNTCILTIAEYSDMYPVKLYYVFKYQDNEILSSGPFRGSLLSIYEDGNTIFGIFEEYNDMGETDEYEEPIMSF